MSMQSSWYPMIFKRKSFHLFRGLEDSHITPDEMDEIYRVFSCLQPLDPEIRVEIKIVPAEETTCERGQEYCILFYSEKKDNYLRNIGYIGEQLDLYLVSKNIGTLWYGIGKVEGTVQSGLDFVIMMAISKVDDERKFRKDMFKSKRKPEGEIWLGEDLPGVSDIIRFAPSACNTQPWIVERDENRLKVFRYKKSGKRGIMPADKVSYYNQIDTGIFLCFLELCLEHEEINYSVQHFLDRGLDDEKVLIAEYHLDPEETHEIGRATFTNQEE